MWGGGCVTAIHDLNLTDGLAVVAGSSAGAPVAAYLHGKEPRKGNTIFSEELTGGRFINASHVFTGEPIVNTKYLADVFAGKVPGSNKALRIDVVRSSHPDFLIAVTDYDTGEGMLLDGKQGDMIERIHASTAIPGISSGPVTIEGRRYCDGGVAMSLPISEIVDRYNLTHVLVLANRPNEARIMQSLPIRIVEEIIRHGVPKPLAEAMRNTETVFAHELAEVRRLSVEKELSYGIVWSGKAVHATTQNPEVLRDAAAQAEAFIKNLYSQATSAG